MEFEVKELNGAWSVWRRVGTMSGGRVSDPVLNGLTKEQAIEKAGLLTSALASNDIASFRGILG